MSTAQSYTRKIAPRSAPRSTLTHTAVKAPGLIPPNLAAMDTRGSGGAGEFGAPVDSLKGKPNRKSVTTTFSATEPEDLLQHVYERMEKLALVYAQELDALSANDMRKFQEIQPEKLKLISDCEGGIDEIGRRKESLAGCSVIIKERLKTMHATLLQLAQQSAHACQLRAISMRRLQDRLLHAARIVANETRSRYGRSGHMTDAARARPMATAINEAI